MTQSMSNKKINFRAWLVWFLASFFVFYKYILEFSPGVLKKQITGYFHITQSEIGFFFAVYYIAYALMQLPIGLLLDRFGPKKVLLVSLSLCLAGSIMLGFLPPQMFTLACCARFLTGVGAASAIIGCMKLISIWFEPSEFAKMTGFMMTVGMLGAGVSENIIQDILTFTNLSWSGLLRFVGYFGLLLCLLYLLFIEDSKPGSKPPAIEKQEGFFTALDVVVRCPQSWVLSLYSGFMFSPVAAFVASWGKSFIHVVDQFTDAQSTGAISFVMFGFALGSPFWGWLSDLVGKRKVFLLIASASSLCLSTIIIYIPGLSVVLVSILFFLLGFIISAFVLSFSMIREIHPRRFAATSVGFMNAFNAILCAGIVYGIGRLIQSYWSGALDSHGHHVFPLQAYFSGMTFVTAVIALSVLLLVFIRETDCKQV